MTTFNVKTGIPTKRSSPWPYGYVREWLYQPTTDVYCWMRGQADDGSGTYTGTPGALITNPADIIYHLLVKRGNGLATTDFNTTSGGGLTMGSFVQARTDLNAKSADAAYKLSVFLTEPINVWDAVAEIQRHCPGLAIYRSAVDNKFQAIVFEGTPGSEKTYTPAFSWADHIAHDQPFGLQESNSADVCTRVYVHYHWFAPEGKCLRTAFITPTDSDDGEGNEDNTRETAAGTSETDYGTKNVFEADYPWIIDKDTAVAQRDFLFDRYSTPKLAVEFSAFLNAADLRLGHVITFNADVDTHMPYIKYGDTATWAAKKFQVIELKHRLRDRRPYTITVTAVEV